MMDFPEVRFDGTLRPSQAEVMKIAEQQLHKGENRLHIVAPPGSGKTVLGLYLWAMHIRCPAVVLSPNSAIQMQWAARTDLFSTKSGRPLIDFASTDPKSSSLLNSLTYQSVTLPRRGGDDLEQGAFQNWIQYLIENDEVSSPEEGQLWIEDLKERNPEYYATRLARNKKVVRDELAIGGEAMRTLHRSAIETLGRLKDAGVGLIILDECHHLLGHWGRVLSDARELLDGPTIVGLTATPPDLNDHRREDVERYQAFFGPVDFQVPVPAVVKDGFLAPYQDLVYFVRPTGDEFSYMANINDKLTELVEELCIQQPPDKDDIPRAAPLPKWLGETLGSLQAGIVKLDSWFDYEKRDPEFAHAARFFLQSIEHPLPQGIPETILPFEWETPQFPTEMEILMPVLGRYIRNALRRSESIADRELAEQATDRLRMFGVQVTETSTQVCASPAGRIMAYSKAKAQALIPILNAEFQVLGDSIRAVVIADYEKTSAVNEEITHLLDEESGGAIQAFRQLLTDPNTDLLDPILITGSTVLIDDDLAEFFLEEARAWLIEDGADVELQLTAQDNDFMVLRGLGSEWSPRLYIRLITAMFQKGVTRCLVGTRGLLGEGWDANKINVLIDLTAAATSMTVNQLRGRSIRLDPEWPEKLADNWDVVCLAPELRKGFDDFHRFAKKHDATYGVCEDGAIEKGPGHVHALFTELGPSDIEDAVGTLNEEMISRTKQRTEARQLWRIGEPFESEPVTALEINYTKNSNVSGFPPFPSHTLAWNHESLSEAVARAVLRSLAELQMIPVPGNAKISTHARAGGFTRLFLKDADEKSSEIFSTALGQVLGPLDKPRYVIPRYIDIAKHNTLSRLLPEFVGKFFIKYERTMAMLHTVPDILAGHKDNVAVFEKHWNDYVSPGKAMYAHRDDSRELIQQAKQNSQIPRAAIRTKDVFLTGESQPLPAAEASEKNSPPQQLPLATNSTPSPEPRTPPAASPGSGRTVNSSRAHRASDGKGSRARRAND